MLLLVVLVLLVVVLVLVVVVGLVVGLALVLGPLGPMVGTCYLYHLTSRWR